MERENGSREQNGGVGQEMSEGRQEGGVGQEGGDE